MSCEYYSYSVFEQFTDKAILDKALGRFDLNTCVRNYSVKGLQVEANTRGAMDALKQCYQVEAARAALKKKGFFVTEKKNPANGKIMLTVRA